MLDSEHVAALRAKGHSFRAIAAALGASRGAVQRAWKRHTEADGDYDDKGDEYGVGPDPPLRPPFVFVGLDAVEDYRGRAAVDSDGRPLGVAPRWRPSPPRTLVKSTATWLFSVLS